MRRNEATVYAALCLAWLMMVGWQCFEHRRVRDAERAGLRTQSSATSIALSASVRAGRQRGLVIRQERLEDNLRELAKTSGLVSIALLNSKGEVVASAGKGAPPDLASLPEQGEQWNTDSVTFVNLVDFGDLPSSTTIVLPPFRPGETSGTLPQGRLQPPPPPPPGGEIGHGREPGSSRPEDTLTTAGRHAGERAAAMAPHAGDARTTVTGAERPRGGGRPAFRRPFWMDKARYDELLKSRGLHGFVISLSRAEYDRSIRADLWQRIIIAAIAALAAGGLAAAWHQLQKTSRLQLRLARASQMNLHLQELNLAAAGLAHETRNPLNIIRGLAQLISQHPSAAGEIQTRAIDITQEVDRVTNRLNEFINYSRPPEPRPAPLNLRTVVLDVVRALDSDIIDKEIRFEPIGLEGAIEADHALLRQMLFNLLLNSIQAVGRGGRIQVEIRPTGFGEAEIEVRDNGPGIPPDQRELVFRPYFTTREDGTGLGLAVVRQIALAHQWEIECLDGGGGARFRIRGVKLAHAPAPGPGAVARA